MSGAALATARSALRAGRVGLPWNVQADLFVAGPAPLDSLGLVLVHEVRTLVGLDVEEVFAHPASNVAWVLCLRHARRLTSTLAFGHLPAVAGAGTDATGDDVPPGRGTAAMREGSPPPVHRFRVSGSHGTLLVDATAPGIQVHGSSAARRTWTGSGATGSDSPFALDVPDEAARGVAQAVLDAAHRSSRDGVPVPVPVDTTPQEAL